MAEVYLRDVAEFYDKDRATKIREEDADEYPNYLSEKFRSTHKDLPIVGQDFTYYMDIMYLSALSEEDTMDLIKRKSRGINIRSNDEIHMNENNFAPQYTCALVIVEATSRRAWGHPLHRKDSREVLYAFKIFLEEIDMKISKLISDMGQEYSKILTYNEDKELFHYFQVNASQNHHTTLSRVDRFIRTLREIIKTYYNKAENPDWVAVFKDLIQRYNNTFHKSLFLENPLNGNRKIFYTPEQVWKNPELRRRIKIKDYLAKYKNYSRLDRNFRVGTIVRYRVMPGQLKYKGHKGYLSLYNAIIRARIGNSFRIQLKSRDDILNDRRDGVRNNFTGPEVVVPARDLVIDKQDKPNYSKYQLEDFFHNHDVPARRPARRGDDDYDSDSEIEPYSDVDDDDDEGGSPPPRARPRIIPDDERNYEEEEEEEEEEEARVSRYGRPLRRNRDSIYQYY